MKKKAIICFFITFLKKEISMKKLIFIILCLQLFLLTGCENTTVFNGKSKDWEIKYVSSSDTNNGGYYDLVIAYIGGEPAPLAINYEYSLPGKFDRKAENLELKDNKIHFEQVACSNCDTVDPPTIPFKIEYNNTSEIIELEPK